MYFITKNTPYHQRYLCRNPMVYELISFALWHATNLPFSISSNAGTASLQMSVQYGHLVWNGQPDGVFSGEGISPAKVIRLFALATFGSGTGTAEIKAWVYG